MGAQAGFGSWTICCQRPLHRVFGAMAHGGKALVAAAAILAVCQIQRQVFVPAPVQRAMPAAAAVASMAALGAPAYAGDIDAAAKKLAAVSYPFLKDIDWNSPIYQQLPGASSQAMLKAVDKALVMGAAMDGKLLQDAVMAHHKAMSSFLQPWARPLQACQSRLSWMFSMRTRRSSI